VEQELEYDSCKFIYHIETI